jgi:hypothetical protein
MLRTRSLAGAQAADFKEICLGRRDKAHQRTEIACRVLVFKAGDCLQNAHSEKPLSKNGRPCGWLWPHAGLPVFFQ